jgi:hypothetical protein
MYIIVHQVVYTAFHSDKVMDIEFSWDYCEVTNRLFKITHTRELG